MRRTRTTGDIVLQNSEFGMQANNNSNHIDYFIRKATKGDPNSLSNPVAVEPRTTKYPTKPRAP